ncbi:DUF1778 domain-containing protein [Planctomicrobium sp. SH661]|uniref:type II toxin -antitoxin system TacA 1-like antitoxin n=1 Tax=Planctomicrobium sp. SH661 TaxID=3448124 RepID=UPI003F5B1D2C
MSKSIQVNIRCEDSQKTVWERAAAADRRTLTDWIRIQLDDAAARQLEEQADKPKRK